MTAFVGDIQFKCQYQAGLNFYDLQPLALAKSYYEIPTFDGTNRTIFIAFCNDLPESLWCDPQQPSMAVIVEDAAHGGNCSSLSGSDPTVDAAFSISNTTSNDGLTITYTGGDSGYGLVVDIPCNQSTYYTPLNISSTDNANIYLQFESQFGCKYD